MKESIKKGIKHVKVPVKFTHFYWVIHLNDLSRIYTGLGGLLLEINKSRCFLKKLSKVIESNEYINILVSSKKLHMVFISGYKGKTGHFSQKKERPYREVATVYVFLNSMTTYRLLSIFQKDTIPVLKQLTTFWKMGSYHQWMRDKSASQVEAQSLHMFGYVTLCAFHTHLPFVV